MWVLVVDDDPDVRRVVRRGLEHQGCQVAEAVDGDSALALLDDHAVDVAVLDRQLPGMPGLELLTQIRRRDPSIHIIMLTGAAAEADRVLGLVSGADDYMVKPFSARELAARVVAARRRRNNAATQLSAESPETWHPSTTPGVESATAAVIVISEGIIVSVSPAAVRLFGAESSADLVDHSLFSFVGVDSLAVVERRYRLADQGGWSHPEVMALTRADGGRCQVLVSSMPAVWQGRRASEVSLREERAGSGTAASGVASDVDDAEVVELQADIRRGVTEREFVVHYQPIVRLADAYVVGLEALVRWQHPSRGLLPPVAFMEAAEGCDAIVELGAFVLDEARDQWNRWQQDGHQVYVSVNLSGRQLADPRLPERIAAVPMPEGKLWLEVTETSLVGDLQKAGDALNRVTAQGPKVAIDDFGTGWASLSYLREFPVHGLKIDRSFVRGVGTSTLDTAIITSVLSLGSELGLKVTAEGVETAGQCERLRELGCELGQGYLFGRPVSPDKLQFTVR